MVSTFGVSEMGIDRLAPTITLTNDSGKGRVTYLSEERPARAFPPTPGLWFSNQPEQARRGAALAGG